LDDLEKRVSKLEVQSEDVEIICREHGDMFTESGERVPVGEPIGYDVGCWRPTNKGRMRVKWAIYRNPDGSERHLLRSCDRAEQGLPPLADHGIVGD